MGGGGSWALPFGVLGFVAAAVLSVLGGGLYFLFWQFDFGAEISSRIDHRSICILRLLLLMWAHCKQLCGRRIIEIPLLSTLLWRRHQCFLINHLHRLIDLLLLKEILCVSLQIVPVVWADPKCSVTEIAWLY